MQKLNVSSLQAVVTGLGTRVQALAQKDATHQDSVDMVTNTLANADAALTAIQNEPDAGPRADLDFSNLDAAVLAFKSNRQISQMDANNVAGLIKLDTPK